MALSVLTPRLCCAHTVSATSGTVTLSTVSQFSAAYLSYKRSIAALWQKMALPCGLYRTRQPLFTDLGAELVTWLGCSITVHGEYSVCTRAIMMLDHHK